MSDQRRTSPRRLVRGLVVAVAAALALFAATSATAGAQSYQGDGGLTCSPASAAAGSTVTCTATGFQPGSEVTFSVGGTVVAVVTADGTGSATASFVLPSDARGTVTVGASGTGADGAPLELTTTVVIVVPGGPQAGGTPAPTSSGGLPVTGSDGTTTLVQVGVGLLALGGVALLVSRRRVAAGDTA